MEFVTIRILPDRDFFLEYRPTDTVRDLKFKLSYLFKMEMKRFTFCFNGEVLRDDYAELQSLGIKNQSVIFLVIKKIGNLPIITETPVCLLHKLISYVNSLFNTPYEEFARTERIIRDLLNNELLQNYAKIDPEARYSLEEEIYLLKNMQRPYSDSTFMVLSKLQDMVFDQFEGSIDGFRCLSSGIAEVYNEEIDDNDCIDTLMYCDDDEQEKKEEQDENHFIFYQPSENYSKETNLKYETKISSEPLPVPKDSPEWQSIEEFAYDSEYIGEFEAMDDISYNEGKNTIIKAL